MMKSEWMPGRRDLFKHAAVAAAGVALSRLPRVFAQQTATGGQTSPFFPGFRTFKAQTSGATINGVIGGQGPPLLLLHGAPLSHISWRRYQARSLGHRTDLLPLHPRE